MNEVSTRTRVCRTVAEWRSIMARYEASGLSSERFCASARIGKSAFCAGVLPTRTRRAVATVRPCSSRYRTRVPWRGTSSLRSAPAWCCGCGVRGAAHLAVRRGDGHAALVRGLGGAGAPPPGSKPPDGSRWSTRHWRASGAGCWWPPSRIDHVLPLHLDEYSIVGNAPIEKLRNLPLHVRSRCDRMPVQRAMVGWRKCDSVAGMVVMRLLEGDQVCRIDQRADAWNNDPPAGCCAAVVVCIKHQPSEALFACIVVRPRLGVALGLIVT